MHYCLYFLLFFTFGLGNSFVHSQAEAPTSHVKVSLLKEEKTIQPGRPFWVGVEVSCEEDWHIYWKNPGEVGMPFNVEWELPQGFSVNLVEWPTPERFETADLVGFGYSGVVQFLALITPSLDLQEGTQASIVAKINWLVCSPLHCEPGAQDLELAFQVSSQEPIQDPQTAAIFAKARSKMPKKEGFFQVTERPSSFEIELPAEVALIGEIQSAIFFADKQQLVDERAAPKIRTEGNKLKIELNKSKPFQPCLEPLKGVLVLHTQKAGKEETNAYEIGFLEPKDLSKQEIAALSSTSLPLLSLDSASTASLDAPNSSFELEGGFWMAMAFAFVGGILLNLMPCVLPVISFKVMSFVKMSGESRWMIFKNGLIFSLGVILSFWVLASAMLLLRFYGQSVGWGFQLQQPLFVVSLASLLFVFALSLFGVFEWGLSFASFAGQAESSKQKEGATGAFFSGVLATAVATPCSGPFLGSAIGFAVTLPFMASLAIFTSLAIGMCFPYLLLAAFPSFLRFLPKPGPWMETFKQLMGFLLIATVLWLLWVFSYQTDTLSLICLLGGLFCFSIAAWGYGKGSHPMTSKPKRLFAYAWTLLFAFFGVESILLPSGSWEDASSGNAAFSAHQKDPWAGWETFSIQRLEELKKSGTPVFIDFTAKWCLICQANHMVLASDAVSKQLDSLGVVKMKADWTKNDPVITAELSKFGRSSVPLYLFYGASGDSDPLILPQVLTPDVIAEHISSKAEGEIALKVEDVD